MMSKNKPKYISKVKGEAIGWNNAPYAVTKTMNGKRIWACPFYQIWHVLIHRVHDHKNHARNPTYIDATICPEWLEFMTFKNWMMQQDWKGKQLDKDTLCPSNKHYSPETCIFISQRINKLMNDSGATRGKYPLGVNMQRNRYHASCMDGAGKKRHLGDYSTPEEAHKAYVDYKYQVIMGVAATIEDPILKSALIFNAMLL